MEQMSLLQQLGIADEEQLFSKDPRQKPYLDAFVQWYNRPERKLDLVNHYHLAESLLKAVEIPENIYSIYGKLALESRTGFPYDKRIGYFLAAAFNMSDKPVQHIMNIPGTCLEGLGYCLSSGKTLVTHTSTNLIGSHASGGTIINCGHILHDGVDIKNVFLKNYGTIHHLNDYGSSIVFNQGSINRIAGVSDNLILDLVGGIRNYDRCSRNLIVEKTTTSLFPKSDTESPQLEERYWFVEDSLDYCMYLHSSETDNLFSEISLHCTQTNDDASIFRFLSSTSGGDDFKATLQHMKDKFWKIVRE